MINKQSLGFQYFLILLSGAVFTVPKRLINITVRGTFRVYQNSDTWSGLPFIYDI